jgi:hypothetical protein
VVTAAAGGKRVGAAALEREFSTARGERERRRHGRRIACVRGMVGASRATLCLAGDKGFAGEAENAVS